MKTSCKILELKNRNSSPLRYFEYRHLLFVFNQKTQAFEKVVFDTTEKFCDLASKYSKPTIDAEEHAFRSKLYGENLINVRVKNIVNLFFEEVL